jgi:hypothetical protein
MKVPDMSAQAPVGTTLALLERQLKVMTAVQARLHYAFKQELRLLSAIIRDYTGPDYDFEPEEGKRTAKQSDYACCDIIPVSDPNAATMSQRVVQYQAVIQMAQMAPDIYDLPQLHRNMLDVLGIKNAEKLIPLEEDMKPKDPVSENMEILKAEPVKAFMFQDHESHIKVHMAMIQDPSIQQLIGQNPKAAQMQAALMAHVAEHTGYAYRRKIEQQLGMSLPPEDEKMTPQVEIALSSMMAQAAQQVLQNSKAQQQQQQAKQQNEDPVIQMQKQELQIRQQEAQTKAQKVQGDMQIAQQKLQADVQKLQAEQALANKRLQIEAADKSDRMHLEEKKLVVTAATNRDRLAAEQERAGTQMGIDIAKPRQGFNKPTGTPKK